MVILTADRLHFLTLRKGLRSRKINGLGTVHPSALTKWYISRRNAPTYESWGRTKKLFLAAARLFWPEGCFRDFFGLKKAEGLLKAQKIPKAKTSLAKAKQDFLFFQMMKNVVH